MVFIKYYFFQLYLKKTGTVAKYIYIMHDLNKKSHAFKERGAFKQILTIHLFCECLNNVSIGNGENK